MLLCKQWTNDKCPRCQSHVEDIPHMLSCLEAGAALTRQRRIQSFRQTLLSKTSGSFQVHLPSTASLLLRQAAQSRDRIGGSSAFSGFLSQQWRDTQQAYWDSSALHRR